MKYDMSNRIGETVADYGVSHRHIARAAGVSPRTINRASNAGYMVTKPVRDAIEAGCCKVSMHTPTAVMAANLEKQVDALRETIGSGLVDDAIESAHSREKAELQKALAARVEEVTSLENDLKAIEKIHDRTANELQAVRKKNATQAASIIQCFAEIHRLQDNLRDAQNCIASQEIEIDHFKGLVAIRIQDLAVYQKALEEADTLAEREGDRCQKMTVHVVELSNKLSVQRAWTWFFVLLAFVATVVGVVK